MRKKLRTAAGSAFAPPGVLVLVLLLCVGGVALAWLGDGGGERSPRRLASGHRPPHAVPLDRREGGRGERDVAGGPAGEQVEARAYPRTYVDDRRAIASRHAFRAVASHATTAAAARSAKVKLRDGWRELGPFTPFVPASVSLTGAPTTESGRVTAMAVDPHCGSPGAGCRLWIAAAGGGIWRTNDGLAGKPAWTPQDSGLPTASFGSLVADASDPSGNTLYAGSGEANGGADNEAGLGLFKTTDGGAHWHGVPGSVPVALNRSIASIAIDPQHPATIYIGTALARHGLSEVSGGRHTPPGAPPLGLYKSVDGGATFTRIFSLPSSTQPPAGGGDWFQGGVNNVQLDPADPSTVYAAVTGYGIWRSAAALEGTPAFRQVFRTRNPNDSFGDRTEFALTRAGGHTRVYAGDSSDDENVSELWRVDGAEGKTAAQLTAPSPAQPNGGWTKLSSPVDGTPGFTSYTYCQNSQCGYDNVVAVPPGRPDEVWLGGSINYGELSGGAHQGRSNGRAVVRSTDAGVTFRDMTAEAAPVPVAVHADEHAIAFDPANPAIAWIGSDGGVVRTDGKYDDGSTSCALRGLNGPDLADCKMLLAGIPNRLFSLNDGLRDLQFQGLSFDPTAPSRRVMGGTQDNGTFSYDGSPTWHETVGGDGGASAFDARRPAVRAHTYFSGQVDVTFTGGESTGWNDISDPLTESGERVAFFFPLRADPVVSGTLFTGLQHVWRTQDSGGRPATLETHCNEFNGPDGAIRCGDWQPLGPDLTSASFGDRAGDYVVAIERAPGDRSTLWAATRTGRVFISHNAQLRPQDVAFTRIDTSATPDRFVSGIAADTRSSNRAWVSYSGYDGYTPATRGHVFEVVYDPRTHKARFSDRSFNLGDQPVAGIARDPVSGDLYAATDYGVLRLPAHTSRWENAAPGLPAVAVYGLELSATGHRLYAATHGRGAWVLALPFPPRARIAGPRRVRVGRRVTYRATHVTTYRRGRVRFRWRLPNGRVVAGRTVRFRVGRRGAQRLRLIVRDPDGLTTRLSKRIVGVRPRRH